MKKRKRTYQRYSVPISYVLDRRTKNREMYFKYVEKQLIIQADCEELTENAIYMLVMNCTEA